MDEKVENTVMELLGMAIAEVCDKYCKYPDQCKSERKDLDEAMKLLETYCNKCPLVRYI